MTGQNPHIGRIPARMIEDLPAEKIPELLASRDGYNSLVEHLQSIKAWVDAVYASIPRNVPDLDLGGQFRGPVVLGGGAAIPEDETLIVNGTAKFFGVTELHSGVASVANVSTEGVFGVSTVVASVSERVIDTMEWQTVIDFTPNAASNYLVYLYIRIKEQDTNLNLILEYTDAGGLQNQIILSNSVQSQGSYSISPIFINAIANYPIKLKVQTSRENETFISASVVGL